MTYYTETNICEATLTRVQAGQSGVWFPAGTRNFLFCTMSRPDPGTTCPPNLLFNRCCWIFHWKIQMEGWKSLRHIPVDCEWSQYCDWEVTDRPPYSSHLLLAISLDCLWSTWLASDVQKIPIIWSKLSSPDYRWSRFLQWWETCLGVMLGQALKCQCEYTNIWCLASATHMSCTHQNQNRVLHSRLLATLLAETPAHISLK